MGKIDNETLCLIDDLAEIVHKLVFSDSNDFEKFERYLELFGVDVFYVAMDFADGYLRVEKGSDKPRIVLNDAKPKNRQRFTLAHELGHLILHQKWMPGRGIKLSEGVLEVTDFRNLNGEEKYSRREHEANEFASAFLMPKRQVYAFVEEVYHNKGSRKMTNYLVAREMSKHFMVSEQAAYYRLKRLQNVKRN